MIICDNRRFAFIHIPKCAGTSVRRALRSIDSTGEAFFRIARHPQLGDVHLAHLTLADLAAFYPESFDRVANYRSMAIIRDPIARFYSAIFQRLREFEGIAQSAITTEMVVADARRVVAYLDGAPERLDLRHVHFNRQSDFIEWDGARIVHDLFAVDDMPAIARHIHAVVGIEIGEDRRNATTELRIGGFKRVQKLLRAPYVRLISTERRKRIREKMTAAGLYKPLEHRQFVQPGSAIDRFIRDYYARDFAIFEACTSRGLAA